MPAKEGSVTLPRGYGKFFGEPFNLARDLPSQHRYRMELHGARLFRRTSGAASDPSAEVTVSDAMVPAMRRRAAQRSLAQVARIGVPLGIISEDTHTVMKDERIEVRLSDLDELIKEDRYRNEKQFFKQEKGEHLRILLARKLLFPSAVVEFDQELFDSVNAEIAYLDRHPTDPSPFNWRVRMEDARNLILLYPDHRDEVAARDGFIELLEREAARALAGGDWENYAAIGASRRIIDPDGFTPIRVKRIWRAMKIHHYELAEVALAAEKEGMKSNARLQYDYFPLLTNYDANLAILGANSVSFSRQGLLELAF